MLKANIAVFVSGGGTNLQALIDAQTAGIIKSGSIQLVVSNNLKAYALERAKNAGIENISLDIMLGVPESSKATLLDSLDFALSLDVPHISAYMLKLEEGTFFYSGKA